MIEINGVNMIINSISNFAKLRLFIVFQELSNGNEGIIGTLNTKEYFRFAVYYCTNETQNFDFRLQRYGRKR